MDEASRDAHRFLNDISAQASFSHFFKERHKLQFSDAGADTAVDAITE
jgi:hypothetical protein